MPNFTATAPGKVILFGDHAVVYGHPAIAVPVTQVQARATIAPGIGLPDGEIQITAPEIALESPLRDLPLDHAIKQAIELTLAALGIEHPTAFKLKITSSIPLAAGLGSGAAVSVAAARAVSAFFGHPLEDEQVNAIAFEVEKIHHGTPSGIDNTVITYAQPVYFIKGQPLETFDIRSPFTLVIGDTGIASPTSVAVGDVRKAWEADRQGYERLFAGCGDIAVRARAAIEGGDVGALGLLMNENHALLQKMGVSSPELDRLVDAARAAGAAGAKLSGGGRGGNMIALALEVDPTLIANALMDAGAKNTVITQVGQ
ncbi:MAG: mevalonate kinase [Anaerolineae bacterium]|nr:MAG: mevalonate kinase [Anaerolineae bacterium]